MAGLFNKFYYGNAGKADFTPDQLPKNRFQLFLAMLRVRFSGIVGQNFLFLLFALPALAWTVINVLAILNVIGYGAEEAVETAAISWDAVRGYISIYILGMIPCLMVASLGKMGEALTLRNWARDDHSFVMSDFKDTLKTNWKQALLIGFINGFSIFAAYVAYIYYNSMAASSVIWVVPEALVFMFVGLWWLCLMVMYPMVVTYEMSFKTIIRNSLIMTIAKLPFALLCGVVPVLIPFLIVWLIPSNIALLVVVLYFLILGFGITHFIHASFANMCFDAYLNTRIEGAEVNKGLRDPSYNEEDEKVTEEDVKNL